MRMNSPNTAPRIVRGGKSIYGAPLGILMLECTNMPPYAAALRDALGLLVYHIYSMITWFHAGIRPRRFG